MNFFDLLKLIFYNMNLNILYNIILFFQKNLNNIFQTIFIFSFLLKDLENFLTNFNM
jgi:hypothetical protein